MTFRMTMTFRARRTSTTLYRHCKTNQFIKYSKL